jgi:hypothetical protein
MAQSAINYGQVFQSKRDALYRLLADCAWHTRSELQAAAGIRYGARILELKREGYAIEDRRVGLVEKSYRLVSRERGEPQAKHVKVYLTEDDARLIAKGYVSGTARSAINDGLRSFDAHRGRL